MEINEQTKQRGYRCSSNAYVYTRRENRGRAGDVQLEEIVVTGIRASFHEVLDIERNGNTLVEPKGRNQAVC